MGFRRPLVQVQSLGPRRRKLHIACGDFFMPCIKKRLALISLLLLSKPDPLRWAPVLFSRFKSSPLLRAAFLSYVCQNQRPTDGSPGREQVRSPLWLQTCPRHVCFSFRFCLAPCLCVCCLPGPSAPGCTPGGWGSRRGGLVTPPTRQGKKGIRIIHRYRLCRKR